MPNKRKSNDDAGSSSPPKNKRMDLTSGELRNVCPICNENILFEEDHLCLATTSTSSLTTQLLESTESVAPGQFSLVQNTELMQNVPREQSPNMPSDEPEILTEQPPIQTESQFDREAKLFSETQLQEKNKSKETSPEKEQVSLPEGPPETMPDDDPETLLEELLLETESQIVIEWECEEEDPSLNKLKISPEEFEDEGCWDTFPAEFELDIIDEEAFELVWNSDLMDILRMDELSDDDLEMPENANTEILNSGEEQQEIEVDEGDRGQRPVNEASEQNDDKK